MNTSTFYSGEAKSTPSTDNSYEAQYPKEQEQKNQYGEDQYGDKNEETHYPNTKNSSYNYSKKNKKAKGPSFISTVYTGIINRAYNVIDIIPCALETIRHVGAITIGLVATPAAAIFSRNERLKELTKLTQDSKLILSNIFETFILILNPNLNDNISYRKKINFNTEKSLVGLLSTEISKTSEGFANSKNFLSKHLICRIIHCVAIPATLIAGIVDLAFGAIFATLTVITLGKVEGLYMFAHLELRGTEAIALAANHFYQVLTPRG